MFKVPNAGTTVRKFTCVCWCHTNFDSIR